MSFLTPTATSADVTWRPVTLGDQDPITGWYALNYPSTYTIKMLLLHKGQSLQVGAFGQYAKYPYTGLTTNPCGEIDKIVDSAGQTYLIKAVEQIWRLNNFDGYMVNLERLPMDADRNTASGTWHVDSTDSVTALQYRNKLLLDSYLTGANLLKDDGDTEASFITQFAHPDYPLPQIFLTKGVDLIFSVARGESPAEALMTRDKKPYAWKESVTITINCINKAGLTAINLLEQAEQEVRRVYGSNPTVTGYTVRKITRGKDTTENYISTVVYGLDLEISYWRLNDQYTATYPKISYGSGAIFDGDDVDPWTFVAGSGATATFSSLESDYYEIDVTDNPDDNSSYIYNTTSLGLSTTLYGNIRYRYAVTGTAKCTIYLLFSDTTSQTILSNGTATTMTVATVPLTTAKTLNDIVVYNASGVGEVFVDFLQVYAGDFVFPNVEKVELIPAIRDAELEVPGMIGSTLQGMGAPSATVEVDACLSMGSWKTPNTSFAVPGSIFLTITQALANNITWEWFDAGDFALRVRYSGRTPTFTLQADLDIVKLEFKEFYMGSRNTELESERFSLT